MVCLCIGMLLERLRAISERHEPWIFELSWTEQSPENWPDLWAGHLNWALLMSKFKCSWTENDIKHNVVWIQSRKVYYKAVFYHISVLKPWELWDIRKIIPTLLCFSCSSFSVVRLMGSSLKSGLSWAWCPAQSSCPKLKSGSARSLTNFN